MPKRQKGSPPALKQERGYAVVYLNGDRIWLGCRFDSPEAKQEHGRILAEWSATGDAIDPNKKKSYSIDDLSLAFLKWAEKVYGNSDFCNYKTAIKTMLEIYSGTLVKDFGPKALKTVQGRFVEKGYARKYCNKLTCFIRSMFVWGIEREFVTPEVAGALKLVSSVHRREAKDGEARTDVPDDVVKKTLPHLLPTIADMIKVQRLAGMRPGEVCRMKVGEIDRSDKVWVYKPPKHKNDWRGQLRIIHFGKHEQKILLPRLEGKTPDKYVFTPTECVGERIERDAASRKTKVQPSQQLRKEKRAKNPKRKFRECYTSQAYCKSITRTIAIVNERLPDGEKIPHWTPYDLRHAQITEQIKSDGIDVARAVAGQKSIKVTQIYNHADVKISIDAAKNRHNPFE